jgi:hypothetical protein
MVVGCTGDKSVPTTLQSGYSLATSMHQRPDPVPMSTKLSIIYGGILTDQRRIYGEWSQNIDLVISLMIVMFIL